MLRFEYPFTGSKCGFQAVFAHLILKNGEKAASKSGSDTENALFSGVLTP